MRPDVRALDAFQRASSAEADLARAQALPDPTVRLGYTYDQFTVSGNQANSLNVTLSLPVTIFDHGQAQLQAAEARRARLQQQRALTLRSSTTRVAALRELLRLQQKRQEAIAKTLPRARAVLDDLQRAANSRLIPFTDVIQARRTLDELLVEEADSYSDSFQTSVDLIAEMGPAAP
jgi:cobalt-zinc-cadmium efflux system outer membrane protein